MDRLAQFHLFIDKANRLLNCSFVNSYKNKSGVDLSWKQGSEPEVCHRGPSQEQTDAFVLTFRFFIQNNDSISFSNMDKAFNANFIPSELRLKFVEAKGHLNNYLDSKTNFEVNGHGVTRRELLDVFIYGELSHTNHAKKVKYDNWMSNRIFATFMKNEFTSILFQVLNVISYTGGICEEVISNTSRT